MSGEIKTGSMKELWRVSSPMMISFLSMGTMLFVDRLYLSWYSHDALGAAVKAGTFAWSFILGILTVASMSEVFVAQFNGAKNYLKLGSPVWQMIWFCLFSYLLFIPLALCSSYIYDPSTQPLEYAYFFSFLMTGPIYCLVPAIGGFFVGRGRPKVLQWLAILGNATNIALDPLFIFGVDGWFPSLGIVGAVIATAIGNLLQVVILLYLFTKKERRTTFGTGNFRFNRELFFGCIRVGLPPALFVALELMGWSLFYTMMAGISPLHLFVASVCQSIVILFFFYGWGIEKGCIALAGNFIGSKEYDKVKTTFYSTMKLHGLFFIFLALLLIVYPDPLINWFFNSPEYAATILSDPDSVRNLIRAGLVFVFLYVVGENIRWAINGILTAAGDTMFLLIAGVFNVWGLMIVPTYFLVYLPEASILTAFSIWFFYAFASAAIIYARFYTGKWRTKQLVNQESHERIESS